MQFRRGTVAASSALTTLLLLAAGCGGSSDTSTAAPAPVEVAETATDAPAEAAPKIDAAAARSRGKTAMFVPAPSEFQSALAAAQVTADLAARIGANGSLDGKSKPVVALETGRRIANVLLASKSGSKESISGHMRAAREGLAALGAPDDLLADVDKVVADYESGAIGATELAPSMDLLNQRVQKGLDQGAGGEIATLVQAGGWVQGVHLLSSSLAESGQTGDAASLVHQPSVLAHFTSYIQNSSAAKAQDPDVLAVIAELELLNSIAQKPALEVADLKAVSTHTGNILARF